MSWRASLLGTRPAARCGRAAGRDGHWAGAAAGRVRTTAAPGGSGGRAARRPAPLRVGRPAPAGAVLLAAVDGPVRRAAVRCMIGSDGGEDGLVALVRWARAG